MDLFFFFFLKKKDGLPINEISCPETATDGNFGGIREQQNATMTSYG